jgi:hypothetical protein
MGIRGAVRGQWRLATTAVPPESCLLNPSLSPPSPTCPSPPPMRW